MSLSYEQAVAALYQAAPESFVAERKRLTTELKTAGDKTGAAALAKLPRPTITAWAVNQLWWRERDEFEELFASALQGGKRQRSGPGVEVHHPAHDAPFLPRNDAARRNDCIAYGNGSPTR